MRKLAHILSSYFHPQKKKKNDLEPCTGNSLVAISPFEPLRYDIIVHEATLSSLSDLTLKDIYIGGFAITGKNVPITITHLPV